MNQQRYFHAQDQLRSYDDVIATVSYTYTYPKTRPDEEERYLSGPAVLATCLRRTALGLYWEPGMKGGRDPYLCDEDAADIEGLVVQHANQMNCPTTLQAIDIAWFLNKTPLISIELIRGLF
jgi:hypothetical protein